ncbi:hypothetical protein [Streptomyces sp. NPDC001815]|uniref:hypothetical protein n=1 Tax=Streptomyces sp. NPDC001815 TaxID=3154526 RepID=UPI0033202130
MRYMLRPDSDAVQRQFSARQRRVGDRIDLAAKGDPEAIASMRDELRRSPDSWEHRIGLIFGLEKRGEVAEALRLAGELASERDGNHFVHFHLTQTYWSSGDRAEARRHALRALATAPTAQDRVDVREMLRVIGASALIPGEGGDG